MHNPLSISSENKDIRAHYKDIKTLALLQKKLTEYLLAARDKTPVLVCIGTDRSTGDCLGPLTGTKLLDKPVPILKVYGTLEKPVNAENLAKVIEQIYKLYPDPYIIALDACLGRLDYIGCITLSSGPVKPGTAVKKELPAIGDIHLTGIVNINGFMEYMVLQNTRLNIVWQLSDAIADILYRVCLTVYKRSYKSTL